MRRDATAEAFRVVADDLRTTRAPTFDIPTEVATAVAINTEGLGHDVEVAEVIETVLAGKYDDAADILDALADSLERDDVAKNGGRS